jgi:hypothetical protein
VEEPQQDLVRSASKGTDLYIAVILVQLAFNNPVADVDDTWAGDAG